VVDRPADSCAAVPVMLSAAAEDGVILAKGRGHGLPTPRRDPLKRRHLSIEELAQLLAAPEYTARPIAGPLPGPRPDCGSPSSKAIRWARPGARRRSAWSPSDADTGFSTANRRRRARRSTGTVPDHAHSSPAEPQEATGSATGGPPADELVFTGKGGAPGSTRRNYRRARARSGRVFVPAFLPSASTFFRHHARVDRRCGDARTFRAVQRRLRHASASFHPSRRISTCSTIALASTPLRTRLRRGKAERTG